MQFCSHTLATFWGSVVSWIVATASNVTDKEYFNRCRKFCLLHSAGESCRSGKERGDSEAPLRWRHLAETWRVGRRHLWGRKTCFRQRGQKVQTHWNTCTSGVWEKRKKRMAGGEWTRGRVLKDEVDQVVKVTLCTSARSLKGLQLQPGAP